MTSRWSILVLRFILPSILAFPAQHCPADEPGDMLVMTYNLRYASRQPPNSWPQRLPVAVALLEKHQPDLIGTQEGVYQQIKDLEERLVDYSWIGLGRDGGSRGEFMAVFYRHDRFEPEEFDHFWLSDTPEVVGSTTWGNSNRRMVTWVRFRDRQSDKSFYFFNTHFDHQIQAAREKSAQLVIERVEKLQTELPVVLVGDFNAAAGENPVYDLLVGEQRFEDTWNTAAMRGPLVATFHGYRGPRNDGPRIDWILIRGPVTCLSTEIVTFQQDGQLPSDHFPVMSRLQISTP